MTSGVIHVARRTRHWPRPSCHQATLPPHCHAVGSVSTVTDSVIPSPTPAIAGNRLNPTLLTSYHGSITTISYTSCLVGQASGSLNAIGSQLHVCNCLSRLYFLTPCVRMHFCVDYERDFVSLCSLDCLRYLVTWVLSR